MVMSVDEPTQLSHEEGHSIENKEFSFSRTRSSYSSRTSTSSLPSTSTCAGRIRRAIILKLRSFVNSRTKRILTISSVISLCFVIGTIIYVATAINALQDDYDWVIHTDQVKVNIAGLYTSLLNADTSSRGFIITGSPSFLGPYNSSLPLIWPYFCTLSDLTADNPMEINALATLKPLITERLIFWNLTIADRTVGGLAAAQLDVLNDSGGVMTAIRGVLNNMTAEESSLLGDREATFQNSIHTLMIVLFVVLACIVLTIVAGLLIGYDWDTKMLTRTNNKLKQLLEKAEEGTRTKSRFLANMSHEIRTPMNGVLAMTQLLSSTALSADQVDMVDTILISAEAMLRLINDLLLFSKIEAGKFTLVPEWFHLPTFLKPVTEMYVARARGKGTSLTTTVDENVPKYFFQDSGRLRQVLVNLCDNAVKFTQHGGVTLRISFVNRQPRKKVSLVSPDTTGNQILVGASAIDSKEDDLWKEHVDSRRPSGTLPSSTPQRGMSNQRPWSPPLSGDINSDGQSDSRLSDPHRRTATDQSACDVRQGAPATNVVSNATDSGLVRFDAGTSQQERYYIIFSVTDTGIGIAPAVQKTIFEPFLQADNSTTREYGGTGLGLSISSQLVKSMGGKLTVKSRLGAGATFDFAVPVTADQLTKSSAMDADAKREEGDDHDQDQQPGDRPVSAVSEEGGGVPLGRVDAGHRILEVRGNRTAPHINESIIPETDAHSVKVDASFTPPSPHLPSSSQFVTWYDWFPDECYDENDRSEQKQMMTQSSLLIFSDHFAIPTSPSLTRVALSAPQLQAPLSLTPAQLELSSSPALLGMSPINQLAFPQSTKEIVGEAPKGSNTVSGYPNTDSHSNAPLGNVSPTSGAQDSRLDTAEVLPSPPAVKPSSARSVSDPAVITGIADASLSTASHMIARRGLVRHNAVITQHGPRLRVLVVEDNPVNQKVARRLLERDGHTVIVANNGREALELWSGDDAGFDVVLMDLHMPIMDGITATRSIRQAESSAAYHTEQMNSAVSIETAEPFPGNTSTLLESARPRRVPIIAVTASVLDEDVKRCEEGGFDDIMHKPIDIRVLSKKMGQLIELKEARMERLRNKVDGGSKELNDDGHSSIVASHQRHAPELASPSDDRR